MNRTSMIILVCILIVLLIILLCWLVPLLPLVHNLFANPIFEVENLRMTACNASNINYACTLQTIGSFLPVQENTICIAWTEVARGPNDTISIYIYDDTSNTKVYTYEEPTPATLLEIRPCRVLTINQTLPPGEYRTEFIVGGSPVRESIRWEIMPSRGDPQVRTQESTLTRLTLTGTAYPTTYTYIGQIITYTYLITNTGNAILQSLVSVKDDKTQVSCPNVTSVGNQDASLDPGESVTCTSTYIITYADIETGSVTSTASITGVNPGLLLEAPMPVTTTINSTCLYPPSGWIIYIVQSGDDLYNISTWYNQLTPEMLMQINCLSGPTIYPGQVLYVPNTPPPAKIRGVVFADPNNNQFQDPDEQGVSGLLIRIKDANGTIVATRITGVNGQFEVDLPAGTYFIFQSQIIVRPGELKYQNFAIVSVSP